MEKIIYECKLKKNFVVFIIVKILIKFYYINNYICYTCFNYVIEN